MFVDRLALCLHDCLPQADPAGEVTGEPVDPALVRDLLDDLRRAPAAEIDDLVVAADPAVVGVAVCRLLREARRQLRDDQPGIESDRGATGRILERVVQRGHGTRVEGGEIAHALALALQGFGSHLSNPTDAGRSYALAARQFDGHGSRTAAALMRLGEATTRWGLLVHLDRTEVDLRFDELGDVAPDVADALAGALETFLATATDVAHALAVEGSTTDPSDESLAMLELLMRARAGEPLIAARAARLVDAQLVARGRPRRALAELSSRLISRRLWSDALLLLQERISLDPTDRDATIAIMRVHIELGNVQEACDIGLSMLPESPSEEDLDVVMLLYHAALQRPDGDPSRWLAEIKRLDPTLLHVEPPAQSEPLLAVVREGTMTIDPSLFERPEADVRARLTAALIADLPEPGPAIDQLQMTDPAHARAVLRLLGLRMGTPEQAEARRRIAEGEAHFTRNRFAEAAECYEAALAKDPDNAEARLFLGDTWYRRGKYDLARAHFEESLAVAPSAAGFRFLGDCIRFGGGTAERARQCYKAALAINPSYVGAREALRSLQTTRDESTDQLGETEVGPSLDGSITVHAALPWMAGAVPFPALPHKIAAAKGAPPDVARADEWDLSASVDEADHVDDAPAAARPARTARSFVEPEPATVTTDFGDRLVAAVRARGGMESGLVEVVDDDEAFETWLAGCSVRDIGAAIMVAVSVTFQYSDKDRDLKRWMLWVRRHQQLAEALPAELSPDDWPLGLSPNRQLADAFRARGGLLEEQGKYPAARAAFERTVEHLASDEADRKAAGLTDEAEFDRVFTQRHPRADALDSLARVCAKLGDSVSAERYAAEAFQLDNERASNEGFVDLDIARGAAAMNDGQLDLALACFHLALERAEDDAGTAVVPRVLTKVFHSLALAHRSLGLYRSALCYVERCIELNEGTGNSVRLGFDHRERANILRARPDLGDARNAYERSLACASVDALSSADPLAWETGDGRWLRISTPERAWDTLLELGRFEEERGQLRPATTVFELAAQIGELVRSGAEDDTARVAIANARTVAHAGVTRLHLRRALLGEAGEPALAWAANEAMRARSFLDALRNDDLPPPSDVPEELVWSEAAALARRRDLQMSPAKDLVFWDELGRLDADLDVIWNGMLDATPTAADYVEVRRSRPADPRDIQGLLAGGPPVVVVSFVAAGDRLAVIGLRSDGGDPIVRERPIDVDRLFGFIRSNFGSASRVRELAMDLEDLFQHEVEPVLSLVTEVSDDGDLVVVIPTGALHSLPFAALRSGDVTLVERNPLAFLPTASLLRPLWLATSRGAEMPFEVFGDPTCDLPGARREAVAVAKALSTKALLGPHASRAAVTNALQRTDVVHIAGHAAFDPSDPLSSGLRLADGMLTAREMLALDARCVSLVTLSACETGVTTTDAAEELVGLTRALLFAGADSLVLSLWKVDDDSTAQTMEHFYGSLGNGVSRAHALQRVALDARARYGAQRFDRWAGFQLVGDWR